MGRPGKQLAKRVTNRWWNEYGRDAGDWGMYLTTINNPHDPHSDLYGIITKCGNKYFGWWRQVGEIRVWDERGKLDTETYDWAYEWVRRMVRLYETSRGFEAAPKPKRGRKVKQAPSRDEVLRAWELMGNLSAFCRGMGVSRPIAERWLKEHGIQ